MKDLMGLLSKAREMQAKMQEMPAEMETLTADGSAGAGAVTVTLNGKGQMQAVKIDPAMIAEGEVEIIEDLVMAAHADAKSKIEAIMAEKTQELTAGMPLPPGMKPPF